jgi:transketolase
MASERSKGEAPRRTACYPRPGRGAARRRERDRHMLARRPGTHQLARGLILTRQNLLVLDRISGKSAPAPSAARGGHTLAESTESSTPDVILIATGSEVQTAHRRRHGMRVVSMPGREWFAAEPMGYQDEILPFEARARVSVEAAVGQG